MTRFRLQASVIALALALPLAVAASHPAAARDANPVEGFMRKVFGPPHRAGKPSRRRVPHSAAKPKAAAAASTAVTAGAVVATDAVSAGAVPVPSPNPHPEPAEAPAKAPKPAGDAATVAVPATETSGNGAASGSDAGNGAAIPADDVPVPSARAPVGPVSDGVEPVPGQPNAVMPAVPAEAQPVDDLPVPETRPADRLASPDAGSPDAGQSGAEPPKPEDAPNSTEKLKSREPVIDPAVSVVAAAAIEDAKECETELKRRGAVFTVEPSISEGECGVLRPVAFERSSSGVKVGPNTQILCRTALALDTWLAESVGPAAKASFPDRRLTEFRQASTYVCRPRASETGISEHARGSAIDIGSFAFDKGPEVGVEAYSAGSPEAGFLDRVRAGACGPFKTVLGPGADPDHATHFHLDIAARRNEATYCK